jgi:hypothetical protein
MPFFTEQDETQGKQDHLGWMWELPDPRGYPLDTRATLMVCENAIIRGESFTVVGYEHKIIGTDAGNQWDYIGGRRGLR